MNSSNSSDANANSQFPFGGNAQILENAFNAFKAMLELVGKYPDIVPSNSASNVEQRTPQPENSSSCTKSSRKQMTLDRWVCKAKKRSPLNLEAEEKRKSSTITHNNSTTISLKTTETQTVNYVPDSGMVSFAVKVPNVAGQKLQYVCTPSGKYFMPVQGLPSNHNTYLLNINESLVQASSVPQNVIEPMENSVIVDQNVELPEIRVMYPDSADGSNCATPIEITNSSLNQFGSYVDNSELQVYSLNPVEGPKGQTCFSNLNSSTTQEKEVLQMLGQISVSEAFISDVNSIETSPLTADNLSTATPNYCDIPDLIEISNSDKVKDLDYVVYDKDINQNNCGDESRLSDTKNGNNVRRSPRQNSSVFKLKQFRKIETKHKKAEIEDDVTLIINSSPEVRCDEDTSPDRTNIKSTALSSTNYMKPNNLEEKQNVEKTILIQEMEFHESENLHKVNNDKIESTEATTSNIFEVNDLDRTNQDYLGSAKGSYEHINENQHDSEATETQDQNVILVNENDEVELMEVVIENNEKDVCLEKEISEQDSLECHSAHRKLAAVKLVLKRNRDAASKNDEETWDIMPGRLLDNSSVEQSTVIQDDTVKYSTHSQKSAKDLLNEEVTHCTEMDIRDLVERDAQNSYEFVLREVLSVDKNHCPMHHDAIQYYQYPEKCVSSPYNLRKRICRTYRSDSITPRQVKQSTRHIPHDSEKGVLENLKSNKTESVKVLARRKLKFNKNESAKSEQIQCTEACPEQVIKHESSSGDAESNLDEMFEPESEQTVHSKSPLKKLFKRNQLKSTKNKSLKTNPLISENDVPVREQNHENFIDGSISDLEGICKSTVNESVNKNSTLTEVSKQKNLKTNKNKTKIKKYPYPEKCTQVRKRDQDYSFKEINELETEENTDSVTTVAKVAKAKILKDAKMKNLKLKTSLLGKVKQVRKPNCEDSLGRSRSNVEGIGEEKKLIGEETVTEVVPRKELRSNQNKTLKITVSPSEGKEVRKQRHNDSLSDSRSSFKERNKSIVEENTNNEEMVTEVVPRKELRSSQVKTSKITVSPSSVGNKVRKRRRNDSLSDSRSSFEEINKLIAEENTSNEETVTEMIPKKELKSNQIRTLKITVSPSSEGTKIKKRKRNDFSDSRSSFEESNKLIVEKNTNSEATVTEMVQRNESRSNQNKTLKTKSLPSEENKNIEKQSHDNALNNSRSSFIESSALVVEENTDNEANLTEVVQRKKLRSSQNKTLKVKVSPLATEDKQVRKNNSEEFLGSSSSSFGKSGKLIMEENTDSTGTVPEMDQKKELKNSENKTLKIKASSSFEDGKKVRKRNRENSLGSSRSSLQESNELMAEEDTDTEATVIEVDQQKDLKNNENKTLKIKVSHSFEVGKKIKKRNRESSVGSSRSSLEESNKLMAEENTGSEATITKVDQKKDLKNSENKTIGIKVSPSFELGQKVREPNHENSLKSPKSSLKENNELVEKENTDSEATVTEVNQEKDLKSRKNKTLKVKMSLPFEKSKKAGKRNHENFLGSSRSGLKENDKLMVEENTNSEITVTEVDQKKELKSSQNQTLKSKKPSKGCKQVRKENQKDALDHSRTDDGEINELMVGETTGGEAIITDMVKNGEVNSRENKTSELKMFRSEKNKKVGKRNHDDTTSSSKCSKLIEKNTDSEGTITEMDKKKEIKDSENETLKIKVLPSSEEKKVRKRNGKKTTGSLKDDFEQRSELTDKNIDCKVIVRKMDHKKELKRSQNRTLKMKKPCKEDKQIRRENQKDSLDHSRTDDGDINELMVGETTGSEATITDMVRNKELNSRENKTSEIKMSRSQKNKKVRKRSHDDIINSSETSFGENSKFIEENSDTETTLIEVDEKKELNSSGSETLKIKVSPSSEEDTKVKKQNRRNSLYSSRDSLEESSKLRFEENTDSEATITEVDQEKKLKNSQNKKLKMKKSFKEVEDKQTEKQILKDSLDDSRSNMERINEVMVGENRDSETTATMVVQKKELRSNSNKTLTKSHSQKEALTQNHADSFENDLEESSKSVREKREETETMKITQEKALKSKNKSKNLKTKESLSSKESKLDKKRNHENTFDDIHSDHESISKSTEEENIENSTTLMNLVQDRELESCKSKALKTNGLLSPSKDNQNDENINRNLEVTGKLILEGRTDNETVLSEVTQERDLLIESGENEILTGNRSAQANDVQKSQGHVLDNCENESESTGKSILEEEEEITNSEKELIKITSKKRYGIDINKSLKKMKMGSRKKEQKQKWRQPNRSKLGKKIGRHLKSVNSSFSETVKHEQTNENLEIKETSSNLEISELSKPIPDSFKTVKHPKQTDLINEGNFESPSLEKFLNQESFLMKSESDSEHEWCEYEWTESDYEREIKALGLPKNKEEKYRQYIKEKFFGQNQEGELFVACKDKDENVCEPYICIVKSGTQDKLEKYGCCIS